MEPKDIFQSTAALLTALATLLGATVSFVKLFRKSSKAPTAEKLKTQKQRGKLSALLRLFKKPAFVIGLLLLSVSIGIFVARGLIASPSLNEQLTTSAWDFLNDQEYEAAIKKADECIAEFGGQALREQQGLTANQVPLPRVGTVSEDEKNVISSRGVLNDVATCYFIKGRALESLKRHADARQAYEAAATFPHARTWDKRRWYWSPADAARDRSAQLP